MAPMPRIATCGWLMTGVPKRLPKTPGLVMVKVPPCVSSGLSFLLRARSARSLAVLASPTRLSWSAFLMTGTSRPRPGMSTAMPMLMSFL
jgi:hypothetical protein